MPTIHPESCRRPLLDGLAGLDAAVTPVRASLAFVQPFKALRTAQHHPKPESLITHCVFARVRRPRVLGLLLGFAHCKYCEGSLAAMDPARQGMLPVVGDDLLNPVLPRSTSRGLGGTSALGSSGFPSSFANVCSRRR